MVHQICARCGLHNDVQNSFCDRCQSPVGGRLQQYTMAAPSERYPWCLLSGGDRHPAAQPGGVHHSDATVDSDDSHFAALHPPSPQSASCQIISLLGDHFRDIMVEAHQPSTIAREPLEKKRKVEMRQQAFGSTLDTLERSYTKLLHEACEGGWSSDIAGRVRDLADSIKWKLHANRPDSEEAGIQMLHDFMEHSQVEFKWQKMITVLEEALGVARQEKSDAYAKLKQSKQKLRDLRL